MSYIGKTPTSVPLTSSDITDGIITTTKIADANVTNPKLTSGSQQNFRNLVINGDMGIAQRSTSAVALAHSSYHTVDRWSQNLTLASAAFTGQQVSDAPAGFENSYKISCTTADTSLAATARLFPLTRIEDRGLGFLKFGSASAQSLTLSFYVKSNKTGTYQINIWHNNPGRFTSQTYAINSANTWEHKTITFIGDQDSAMANDSGSGLQIEYVLLGGTNYTSGSVNTGAYASTAANRAAGQTVNLADSTSNSWQITGVQLEAGTTASDFEFLPVDVNLGRCQRYFFKLLSNRWLYTISRTADYHRNDINFPVQMRATPTSAVSFSDSGSGTGVQYESAESVTAFINGFSGITDITGGTFEAEL